MRTALKTLGTGLAISLASGFAVQAAEQSHYYEGKAAVPVWIDRNAGTISRSAPAATQQSQAIDADARAAKLPFAPSASAQVVTPSPAMSLKAQRTAPGARSLSDALPGGVLVRLKTPLASSEARSYLVNRGLDPVREISASSGLWLVASAPGEASLNLANSLHESGDFEFAQPNWRGSRTTK